MKHSIKEMPYEGQLLSTTKSVIIDFGKYKGVDINVVRETDYSYYVWAVKNKIIPFVEHNRLYSSISGPVIKTYGCSVFDPEDHYYEDMMNGGCC